MSGDGRNAPGAPGVVDPVAMARRDLRKALPRRFFAQATPAALAGGFGVHLDGRAVLTPAKAPLVVPTAALAAALADEWQGQKDVIEPDTMPMTRLANSAIDGVRGALEATAAEVAKFAETDLVCYRAADPASLVEAEAAAWDPVLAFARDDLGARFVCVEGVTFVEQPAPACAAVRAAVDALARGSGGPFRLAALSVMTNLTGSVLLALAVTRGRMDAQAAWAAAHVDEDHQMRFWGLDAAALERKARRWRDMDAAARVERLAWAAVLESEKP